MVSAGGDLWKRLNDMLAGLDRNRRPQRSEGMSRKRHRYQGQQYTGVAVRQLDAIGSGLIPRVQTPAVEQNGPRELGLVEAGRGRVCFPTVMT